MHSQQPSVGAGASAYPSPHNTELLGPAIPYPPQPPQQLQQQLPQQLQQHPQQTLMVSGPMTGLPEDSQPPQQQMTGGPAHSLSEQMQQMQLSSGTAVSPPKSPGFMRFFRKQASEQGAISASQTDSLQQATSPPLSGGGSRQGSPERRRILGIFTRSGAMSDQRQQPQVQQQVYPPEQAGAAAGPGLYPPIPGSNVGQASSPQGGLGDARQTGVPVVSASGGLCSRAPPPPEELARLQANPLAPSKFNMLNKPPSLSRGRSFSAPGTPTVELAVDPHFTGPPPLEEKYGPYLRYAGYDVATRIYSASVMMVIHQTRSRYPPTLRYRDTHRHGTTEEVKNPVRLFSYAGYNFWRWDMSFQLAVNQPAVAEYYVICSEDHIFTVHKRYHFHLPAAGQKWHWGFYSCNGFHDAADDLRNGGIQPLWRDVMHVHARDPLHVMFGGGDQLYCDDVWKVSSLLQWTSIKDKPSRNAHPFSQQMVNEVFDFYFRNYTTHFGKSVFRDALASIPQVMVWDDHDIFDGWGSYPEELQRCPVFSGVFYVARKFYLLFQCHAAESNYRELNRGWGLTGMSYTVMLGNTTAVVGLDSRGERSRDQIIRPASWAAFSDQVAKLPAGVRHVVVLATVPLIYPTVPGIEEAMMALAGTGLMATALTAFLQRTGLSSQIYSQFGEPELLDDLLDHWSARTHEVEKYCFVRMMQDLAKARGFRFSILSGDVHCAGVATLQTIPKANLKTDHRYMVQVISSAIGNVPPPDAVIKALTASNKPKMLDPVTKEKMKGIFENNCLLKASRNWCDIHERPLVEGATATAAKVGGGVSGGIADGSLVFQLRVEHPIYKEVRPYTYDIVAPLLELRSGSFSPVPLPVAPPLPPPLMLKFQEELVAAGVGLEAAMPLREGAAPLASGSATITRAPAGMAPSATPMVASVTSAAMAPVGGNPDFGLQSDINQHQQNRGLPPMPAPALGQHPGGYGGLPSTGQTAAPTAAFYQPPPLSGSVPYDGGAAQPPMYSGGVATVPPAAGAPGMAYPPMTMPRPTEYVPQPNPQQPGYGPHSQLPPLGSVSYPSYYAAPVPYSPVGSTYMPHGQAQYSQPVTQQAMGYMPPPTAPYTDAPPPSPYGVYPGH